MSSTAEVWRKVVHTMQRSLEWIRYVTKTLRANMYGHKTVDQFLQLRDVTSNYFMLTG